MTQHAHGLRLNNLRKNLDKLLPQKEEFQARHIGPREHEQMEMLKLIGFKVTYTCEIFSFINEKSKFFLINRGLILLAIRYCRILMN